MTFLIIGIFIFVIVLGFATIIRRLKRYNNKYTFAQEYRNNFVSFTNNYFETKNHYYDQEIFDSKKYYWLTKNVNRIQSDLGHLGSMFYVAPFRLYTISDYQIIINTIPKFRDGKITQFDITSVDDCLIRYLGVMEEAIFNAQKKIWNPIVWFQEGFREIFSLPLYVLNWFGIIPDNAVFKVMTNLFYKIFVGIGALISFASGLVTIIQGKQQTIDFFNNIFGR